MNRNVLFLIAGGVVVALLGVVAFAVTLYCALPQFDRPGNPGDPPPFTLTQMQDLHDNPDKAGKEIPKIIACFENGDDDLRFLGAETLKNVGARAVEPLRANLSHQSGEVRFGCAQALAFLKTDAAPAVPELLICIHDVDPSVRYKAVYALGQTGVRTDAVFKGLLEALEDTDDRVPETAFLVLAEIDAPPKEALPTLAKLATKHTAPPAVRYASIKLLGKMGEPAVPTLRDLLKQSNPEGQSNVIQAISLLGPGAKALLPDLRPILIQQTRMAPTIDSNLIEIFKKGGPDGAKGLADALKGAEGEHIGWGSRLLLLQAIGEIGPKADVTVPILIELLNSKKPHNDREQILQTLGDIGPAAKAAIPTVEALLTDPAIEAAARVALRRMGKLEKSSAALPLNYRELEALHEKLDKAADQIPRLLACFDEKDEDVRLLAAEILGKLGAKAVNPLRAKLNAKNASVRFWCVQSLALIGKDAASALDDVLARVQDDDASVRYKAIYTLGKLGVQSDAVFAALLKALEDKDGSVIETAIEVLDKMDTPPKGALPALAKLATKGQGPVRHSATKLLAKLGAPAVPTFRELLKNKNANERRLVIQAMVPLGPDAKTLTPELLAIVTEQIYPGGFIDGNLYEILKKCGPDAAKGLADILKVRDKDAIAFIARASLLKTIGEMHSEADAKATVPILIELLKSGTPTHPVCEYRHLILEALGDIGPAAKAAIPTVESLTTPDLKGLNQQQQADARNVAAAATAALRRMGKRDTNPKR